MLHYITDAIIRKESISLSLTFLHFFLPIHDDSLYDLRERYFSPLLFLPRPMLCLSMHFVLGSEKTCSRSGREGGGKRDAIDHHLDLKARRQETKKREKREEKHAKERDAL